MQGIEGTEWGDLTALALLELGLVGQMEGQTGERGHPAVT